MQDTVEAEGKVMDDFLFVGKSERRIRNGARDGKIMYDAYVRQDGKR